MGHRWFRSVRVLMVGAAFGIGFSGCGGEEKESGLVPVKGRVTLDGGGWPMPGTITFSPREENVTYSAASAQFDKDGNFVVVGGYGDSAGMHPGEYWVSVDCPEDPGMMLLPDEKKAPKNFAPEKYRRPDTSGLSLEVPANGAAIEKAFEVKTNG